MYCTIYLYLELEHSPFVCVTGCCGLCVAVGLKNVTS